MEATTSAGTCPHCGSSDLTAPASPHHLPPGTKLQGKYLIGRVLGQGGFGITYLAYDLTLDLKLAIKEFFPHGLVARVPGKITVETYTGEHRQHYQYGLERFLGEAKTLARFSESPNIVTIRDYFEGNGTAYMVMNYVEGVTFEAYIKAKGGKISFNEAINVIMPVLDALKEVHSSGILHRDVSPDNIYIDKSGRVRLIDFGAARQELQQLSRSFSTIMKAGFSPPEQYQNRDKQGPWTDIYAVAATIYRAVTGQAPPEAMDRILAEDTFNNPSQLGIRISPHHELALLKAMALKSKDRYQTVEAFQEDLLDKELIVDEEFSEAIKAETEKPTKSQNEYKDTHKCPYCKEQIKTSEKVCSNCRKTLQENILNAKKKPKSPHMPAPKPLNKILTVATVAILGLVMAFYVGSWLFAEPIEKIAIGGFRIDEDHQKDLIPMIEKNGMFFISVPDEEIKAPEQLLHYNLIYAVKSSYNTSVFIRDIRKGSDTTLLEFDEFREAELSGNYWAGLLPSIDFVPYRGQIAFIDNEGLKVYDLNNENIEVLIQLITKGDLEDNRPPVWSEPLLNISDDYWSSTVILAKPLWSKDGKYISFRQGAPGFSSFGLIDADTGQYSFLNSISPSSFVWSPINQSYIQASSDEFSGSVGLWISNENDISQAEDLTSKLDKPEYTYYYKANFSPTGNQIVFIYNCPESYHTKRLAIATKNGSDYELIAENVLDIKPFFSIDGDLVFYYIEDNDQTVLVKYNINNKETTKFIVMPSEFNYWEKPYWTEEGYLVMVGIKKSLPYGDAGDSARMYILDIDNKYVIYASPLMDGFTKFAGFTNSN